MSRFVLVCLLTILMPDLTIAHSRTKWSKTQDIFTGTCPASCRPGFYPDVSYEINGDVFCPEKTEDSTKSFLPWSHEFSLYSPSTDFFTVGEVLFYKVEIRSMAVEVPFEQAGRSGNGSKLLQTLNERLIGTSRSRYRKRGPLHEVKNISLQTTVTFPAEDIQNATCKLKTVLWVSGGIFMALVLGLASIMICCTKCQRNNQEPSATALPSSNPASPVTETTRPKAVVCPIKIHQGAASSREESRPLLSPEYSHTSYSEIQNQSGSNENIIFDLRLSSASTLDPSSITEDQPRWEDVEDIVDLSIRVNDQSPIECDSLSNEEIDSATSTKNNYSPINFLFESGNFRD